MLGGSCMTVRLNLYEGDPPSLQDLAGRFGLDDDFVFLTANSAIERMRVEEGLQPPFQVAAGGDVLLAFNKAVRHLVAMPMLSRTEERVLFRRAIDGLTVPDE